jgi:septum formation topological specificity factor MinE
MKNYIFAGNVPYLAVALLIATAFYLGLEISNLTAKPAPKIAFAEKGAAILEVVLAHQNIPPAALDEQVKKPILTVIKRYVDKGYLVIDSSRDENGNMYIDGVPDGAINITAEIRAALKLPESSKTVVQTPPNTATKQ